MITTTDSLGHSTINGYDDLGRVITVTDALGNQTLYEYNALGNKTAMIDAEGVQTTYVYDGLNRQKKVIENDIDGPPNTTEEDVTTEYLYDALGNRVVITNANNISTQTSYDALNWPVVITDAVGNETRYKYDALSNRTVMTDGNMAVTLYTYNALNRLILTNYLSDTEAVTYTYDAAGNRLVMTDSVGVTTYEYDGFYRLITATNPFNDVIVYAYDLAGNREHLTYPDGKVVTYTYDMDNRLVVVEDWDTGLTTYDYDPAGRLVTTTLPNGVVTVNTYDNANRLTSLVHEGDNGLLLARFLYRLDKVGNRVVVTETLATPGVGGLAALASVPDNRLSGQEGPVTAEVVLAALTGAGTNSAQAKPTSHSSGIPYPWSMNATELAFTPPEQANPASGLTIRLARTTLTADGRDGTHILVLVTDADGRPVADGTRVNFQATGGQIRPTTDTTTNGLVIAWLTVGRQAGPGQVTVNAGQLSEMVDFTLTAPSPGSLRVDEPAGGPPDQLPFDLAEVVERASNTIEAPEGRPPFIERPGHRAVFDNGQLHFTPQGKVTTTVPLSLAFQLAGVSIGEVPLFSGPATATVSLDGNVAHLVRGENLVEEFVARDSGIEQRWRIPANPGLPGDLTIAVEVETALELAYAPGGEGFLFRAVEAETGQVVDAAGYDRAIALDANGRAKRAWLSAEELEPSPTGLHRYRLTMTIPSSWLAEASYPVMVDPLIGGLIHVDAASQDGSQSRPAVAYDSNNDQYLVVWQDTRNGNADIYGQFVSAEGDLDDTNFAIYAGENNQIAPDVAYNPDESTFLVVWDDDLETNTIMGQVIDSDGGAVTEFIDIDENTTDSSDNPTATYSAAEQLWLVVWQGMAEQSNVVDIYARTVDAEGNMDDVFAVYEPAEDAATPDVAANGSGGFLVAWEQTVNEFQNNADIYLRRVTGTAVDGTVFYTSTIGTQTAPALVYNSDDDQYLLAWQDLDEYGFFGYDAIWARAVKGVTDTNQFAGNPFQVSGIVTADSATPAVTYFSPSAASGGDGLYLVAWQQTTTGGALNLQAQLVMTNSALSGSTLALSSADNDQADVALGFGPAITNTLAAWTDEQNGTADIYTRLVEPEGTMGGEFKLNTATDDQVNPQVAYNSDDDEYLVIWEDYRDGTGNPDVYGQRISGDGVLVGDNFAVAETANEELAPEVAYGSGVYLVAWRYRTGSDTGTVYGQIVSPTGELAGSPLVIMSASSTQQPTDIIYNPDIEKFFVLWKDLRTGTWDTWGRHVSPDGGMRPAIQITNVGGQHEVNAEGAYNPDDQQYLIVWEQGSSSRNIEARRILISETVVTAETISIAATGSDEREPDVIYLPAAGRYAVVWRGGSAADIFGRLVIPDGNLEGGAFTISDNAADERGPRIAGDGGGGALVVWWRDNGSGQKDLYGRQLDPNGQLLESAFTILEQEEVQDRPVVVGAGNGQYLLAWQDDRNNSWDIYASLYRQEHDQVVISYTYDPLYRLVAADYTGAISATYEYQYDPVGNRTAYTTTITSTEVITYLYDNANRLVETVVIGGDTTTYTWDNASRLITTTVAGQVSRVYQYSQDGDLITATVDSLVTAFAYDGDGRRLLMSVAGEVTTYTLDYAFFGTRILFEDGPDDNKHYLYGVQCIAEVVDEGTAEEEWRYYQRDGNHMVRQTTNETAEVTLAWTYTPEGIVLVGEEGPVTYLDCGSGGIYDWSTGLIFKDGRFFDPSTGIWITLSGVVVYYHVGQARGRKRKFGKGKKRRVLLLLLLVLVALALAGCDSPEPECPTSTPETLPLDGYAYFSDSLPGQTTKPWKPDEKETVKTDLNNAVNVIAGANGFGSRDNLFMEIGIDKENPIILIRQEAGRFPITRLRANNPLMFVYDAYIENPDPNLGPSLFGHELAHFWDQNKNREPSSSMIDWKNWGAAATDIAAGDDLEDFAEAFRIYFWPRYDQGKEWTDDFGAGMRNHRIGVIEEPDSLYLDPNDPSKPPTTTPTELRVQDRYDWFQNEFTGTW